VVQTAKNYLVQNASSMLQFMDVFWKSKAINLTHVFEWQERGLSVFIDYKIRAFCFYIIP
jgi:hypothetical protein